MRTDDAPDSPALWPKQHESASNDRQFVPRFDRLQALYVTHMAARPTPKGGAVSNISLLVRPSYRSPRVPTPLRPYRFGHDALRPMVFASRMIRFKGIGLGRALGGCRSLKMAGLP